MKLLNTWFCDAIVRSSFSAAASPMAAGMRIWLVRAIERGTMLSISARREASPITDSMWRSSASSMPMWRGTNSAGFSSSPSGGADCISMEAPENCDAGLDPASMDCGSGRNDS
jgi:hypothetical protein